MGLGISYVARVAYPAAADELLAEAAAKAKSLRWKAARGRRGVPRVDFTPHARCEHVILDFSEGLSCEHSVKTNYAPARVHIAIVEFLDSIKPLCKSLKVEDELGYWRGGDQAALAKRLAEFNQVLGAEPRSAPERPITFTLGEVVVTSGGRVDKRKGKRVTVR